MVGWMGRSNTSKEGGGQWRGHLAAAGEESGRVGMMMMVVLELEVGRGILEAQRECERGWSFPSAGRPELRNFAVNSGWAVRPMHVPGTLTSNFQYPSASLTHLNSTGIWSRSAAIFQFSNRPIFVEITCSLGIQRSVTQAVPPHECLTAFLQVPRRMQTTQVSGYLGQSDPCRPSIDKRKSCPTAPPTVSR